MHYAVVRRYSDSKVLADALAARQDEVHALMSSVQGFVTYYAVRDGDALITVTVCEDKAGTDESTRRAAQWVRENLAEAGIAPPEVTEGEVFINAPR
jgi:hypothetical protein